MEPVVRVEGQIPSLLIRLKAELAVVSSFVPQKAFFPSKDSIFHRVQDSLLFMASLFGGFGGFESFGGDGRNEVGPYFPADQYICELDESNWHLKISSEKDVAIVFFYVNGCARCDKLKTVFSKVANAMKGSLVMGAVNCGKSVTLCRRFSVAAYPSLLLFGYRMHRYYIRVIDIT